MGLPFKAERSNRTDDIWRRTEVPDRKKSEVGETTMALSELERTERT